MYLLLHEFLAPTGALEEGIDSSILLKNNTLPNYGTRHFLEDFTNIKYIKLLI